MVTWYPGNKSPASERSIGLIETSNRQHCAEARETAMYLHLYAREAN